jgi:aspartate-semialdehyde dehydrogenase
MNRNTENSGYRAGIVGATGAVGPEILRLLINRKFPAVDIRLLASARSAGKTIEMDGRRWTVEETTEEVFKTLDVAIFSAGAEQSLAFAPAAVKHGCVVIDNSSAFRMNPHVPLVVPEINPHAVDGHAGIIANPNCTTAIALMGLCPLHREFGLKKFIASTYQAVSGSGAEAIVELDVQTRAWARGEPVVSKFYPHQIAFNLLPRVDAFLEDGYTTEEMKMRDEGAKILEIPGLRATTTCVRVPVFRAHSVSISAQFERPVDLERARAAIAAFPGTELDDDPAGNRYPMPLDYTARENCGVGRLRLDGVFENGLAFWVVGDQLWKGAALNAVQIAELLDRRGSLRRAVQPV